MGRETIFFDVHCHAMNLSHPGLVVFVRRFINTLIRNRGTHKNFITFMADTVIGAWRLVIGLVIAGKFLICSLLKIEFYQGQRKGFLARAWQLFANQKYVQRVANLLCIMEQDMGEFFTLMEQDVLKVMNDDRAIVLHDQPENPKGFTKIVLTPLIMDFGHKQDSWLVKTHYKILHKPVDEQIIDVLNGIKWYRSKSGAFLEMYPFLGINTANYSLEELQKRLAISFGAYKNCSGEERLKKLSEQCGKFTGKIDDIGDFNFAGVKVYPPLGFDPWPDHSDEELDKVKMLYGFCIDSRLPITAHCSQGGFCVVDKKTANTFTSPDRWEKALKAFPALKLDCAHFGGGIVDKNSAWMNKITYLVQHFENVYTDFACQCFNEKNYRFLGGYLDAHKNDPAPYKLEDKVLFGTDFMINLFWTDSYEDYLKRFIETDGLHGYKHNFCCDNPYRFLFG
jgi:Predicted metal-dependent hydrolase of the TIM-barrel fold